MDDYYNLMSALCEGFRLDSRISKESARAIIIDFIKDRDHLKNIQINGLKRHNEQLEIELEMYKKGLNDFKDAIKKPHQPSLSERLING